MNRKKLQLQALMTVAFLLGGCASRPAHIPSVITAAVAAAALPPREDMMNPIVMQNVFTDIDALEKNFEWKPFRPGVEIARIYNTPDGGPSAAFLKYQPGASVPLHMHGGYEHIFVLKGSQVDRSGEHGAGSVIINPPGSSHQVSSPRGCIVMIIWEKPVILAEAK